MPKAKTTRRRTRSRPTVRAAKAKPRATKHFDLITIGSATWDAIITADDATVLEEAGQRYLAYPYGEKIYLDQAFFGYGGGASNVAVAAARLGLKTSFIGALGLYRMGDLILDNFHRQGVDTSHVSRLKGSRTGISIVLTAPDGERCILLYRGANNHLTAAEVEWHACTSTKWLYVSSLSGESDRLYDQVAATARRHRVKLALNPGHTQIKRGPKGLHTALAAADLLFLNEDEARELLRQRGQAGETVPEMLAFLQKISRGVVVITQGRDGAQASDGRRHYQLPAFTDKRVNVLGAGDAFGATFTVARIKGLSVPQALRLAGINAAAVVADYGAQTALLEWPELAKRAAANKNFRAQSRRLA